MGVAHLLPELNYLRVGEGKQTTFKENIFSPFSSRMTAAASTDNYRRVRNKSLHVERAHNALFSDQRTGWVHVASAQCMGFVKIGHKDDPNSIVHRAWS